MRVTTLGIAAAALLTAGCGAAAEPSAEGGEPLGVRAVDRPAPGAHRPGAQVQIELRLEPSSDPCAEPQTPEDVMTCDVDRRMKADEERERARFETELTPVEGSEPRVVAELPLETGGVAELVAWRARNGKTCTLARITPEQPRGFSALRVGECVRFMPCTELCLAVLTTDDRTGVLAGTVPDAAETLRLEGPNDSVRDYPLDGPVISGTKLRVFIADLGLEDWWSAELRRGGETVASDDKIGTFLRGLRCASDAVEAVHECYLAEPAPPQPKPPADDRGSEYSCERQFDDVDAGFQYCVEGAVEDEE